MNKGQILMLLSVMAILIISYLIPQSKKRLFTCVSWLMCGIFLYYLFMSAGFSYEEYLTGEISISRSAELFFSLNDDFTPEIQFGYISSIIIVIFTFMAGLLSVLLNLSKRNVMSTEIHITYIKPIYIILSMSVLMYLFPLPFYFSSIDFEYFIIHGTLIIPVIYFASSLYMGLTKSFRWYFPLIVYIPIIPVIMFLVVNSSWLTYLSSAIYIGFAYLGALCALIINKINTPKLLKA